MYTLTLEELRERARDFFRGGTGLLSLKDQEEYLEDLVELAYNSGHHDGFYKARAKEVKR